ncbi:MAG TPA: hypothetical protein PLL86_23725, partial [Leptospiraceae bacterium]|nr:hypothetical protein [Leptospiraceae bacterium]
MEEKKDNKSIKDKLLQGQDSSHKKIVIKRKSPIAETPATNVNPPKPKKDLDLLVKEETERQQAAPKPFMKTVDDSKIIVNRNVSETFQQKEKEKEKDVSETQTQQQSKETNVHQETRKQNINQQQSNTSQQSSRPHPAYPVRSADRNPIVSRPQKPVGGQQSNRDNSSQGSGNRPNRPQGNYQGQGGGNRNFHQKHPRPNQGGGN